MAAEKEDFKYFFFPFQICFYFSFFNFFLCSGENLHRGITGLHIVNRACEIGRKEILSLVTETGLNV